LSEKYRLGPLTASHASGKRQRGRLKSDPIPGRGPQSTLAWAELSPAAGSRPSWASTAAR
jgi:hypothetical protein